MSESPSSPISDQDPALRSLLEGVSGEIGERFFASLVRSLAGALGTCGAWVTEYDCEALRLRALAFWLDDRFVEGYEYELSGTPCEPVIHKGCLIHFSDNIVDLFPGDPSLKEMKAVSYMGLPLRDIDGTTLGHLAVLDRKPMPEEFRARALIQIFGARAAAELQRLRAERQVREREEKLRRLFEGAMDAIIEIDSGRSVTQMNPAAERLFGLGAEQAAGREFDRLLAPECGARLVEHIRRLEAGTPGKPHMWIPGGLQVIRRGGGRVFTEATLSRSETRSGGHFILILRNVSERLEAERKIRSLTSETEYLRQEVRSVHQLGSIIGESESMRRMLDEVRQVAGTDATVLILGETGTGKELLAREIHDRSRRRDGPFIKVNCAAIPGSLIESEFFGHEKGAFTGATGKRDGRFALADRGTILLDEITELHVDLQGKLLRVLQEGEFEPVGSSRTRKVDVRVLAATNRDLEAAVRDGRFREDLYYRLNVYPIRVPPLRERGNDIGLLATNFLERFSKRMGKPVQPLSRRCRETLGSYDWPGNVRELQNVIERALITSREGRLDLDRIVPGAEAMPPPEPPSPPGSRAPGIRTVQELRRLERRNLIAALESAGWRVSGSDGAARLLGMKPSTLSSRMKALGVKRPR